MRTIINFNDSWSFRKPGEEAKAVSLPHTWNNVDGQDGGDDYWRGTATYSKQFAKPSLNSGERCYIEFLGAAMTADVILNGKLLAHHEGGYSAFRADLTDALEAENLLVVSVDNSANDRVYPQMADFTFYGGLYRDVNLIVVPAEHFVLDKDGTPGIRVTPDVRLKEGEAYVMVETWQTGGTEVWIEVPTEHTKEFRRVEAGGGHAVTNIILKNVRLWDGLDDPYLYTVTAKLMRDGEVLDEISARFGCREFHIDPNGGFFLNGRSYPLRGVSRHQDRIGLGSALTIREHQEDMAVVKELGANTLRLAHYQHAQEFYDLCDENGIIVWAEIPYITRHMPGGRRNAASQMKELITQCCNHPSIVCWGLSNEITASSPVTEELLQDHRELNALCHELDSTRPTVMAHAFMLEKDSPLIPIADLASYNLYFGWYLGELEQNEQFFDEYHAMYPDRVIGFSEYGADANAAFHSSRPEQGDYTEEYQCVYHEHMLKIIEERPWLWATHVWNLFDFAADGRDEGGKKGENQKGLVAFDHRTRKDAFYLYKAAWSKEPFVHLCGKRYVDRAEEKTGIRVYSNCESVTLIVDGKELETKSGRTVFTFSVPITGEHMIEAVSGECRDAMTVRRVETPNESYIFGGAGNVVNWFDKEDIKPGYYSIKDRFGELMANPASAAIVGRIMAKASASRGEVAQGTKDNKALQQMMAGLSLESLLKKAGANVVPPEAVRSINAALQQIKKEGGA
ncbi:MAG: glycoside hydrolase family 2 protein [Oscillospiraceae bacterium]|nr:glycoside hydrolase family 2 protein [Oscillospiraceae bacterium]